MRFPLRLKFFVFATLLAIAPLALVGQNLTRLTRDELKSAANEDLTLVADELSNAFDNTWRGRWMSALLVIRNGVDSDALGVQQKVSLLTLGLQELPDVMSLQLTVQGSDLPILVTNEAYAARLTALGEDPVKLLATTAEVVQAIAATGQFGRPLIERLPATGDWVATLALPLTTKIAGRTVTMAARIELSSLAETVARHPFAQRGDITVVDHAGRSVLGGVPQVLADREIVAAAMPLIVASARADALLPYVRPDGRAMLGAYAFPDWFPWAVITELSEDNAYAVVNAITRQILIIGLVGFSLASLGALIFARALTRPILKIGRVVGQVGEGDFSARVEGVTSRDEIGELAGRINRMIVDLRERLELMKFVSRGTVSAIQRSDESGLSRGGERRRISVLFTDIRGYTAFSETVPPEVVIEALNTYFDVQTDIVERHGGDVDKFIGDALVTTFEGEGMERRATACAVEIAEAMMGLLEAYPDYDLHVGIGVASGEAVMGAMGARERMDFTVLGSTVNKAARLCSAAAPDEVLVDEATREAGADLGDVVFQAMPPIPLKGYAEPVAAYAVVRGPVPDRV
ncbi:MAG: hypothetical protein CML68_22990 [Rhodobacteraceae bacterium]|nr:hypothetical protein [Paracoccaceae bacterium]